jgi:hypothetical protein
MAKSIGTKAAIISDLAACKKAFDQINIPWVIQGGAVLGYGRYKDIMSWDTDLDMAVFAKVSVAQRKTIFNSMRKCGFRIAENSKDFIMGKRKVTLNLWFFHKKGEFYEAFPATTPGYKFVEKAIWYDEPQIVEFLGSEYPMPNHLDDFLDAHYGTDWKTNIVKNHGTYFKQKRGKRNNIPDWYSNRRRKSDGQLWWPAILKIGENIEDLLP